MNDTTPDWISLVIHTQGRAERLKGVLEAHGISVRLEALGLDATVEGGPEKVMVPVTDLSLALKVIESGDFIAPASEMLKMTGTSRTLLIPVDFSPASLTAVKVGFILARKFSVEPIILNAFIAPYIPQQNPNPDFEPETDEVELVIEDDDLRKAASVRLSRFKKEIAARQLSGDIPDVKFSTTLLEGVAEDVIRQYCRLNKPTMVVMATRDRLKKAVDLVGSVTAEVIDSCRVPVFSIPDSYSHTGLNYFNKILMFCSGSRQDLVMVRALMRAFDFPACEVWLVPVSDHAAIGNLAGVAEFRKYCQEAYPAASFHEESFKGNDFGANLNYSVSAHDIKLIIAPNRKSNIISRLFRPTIAHRCLFERDVPLLALPV